MSITAKTADTQAPHPLVQDLHDKVRNLLTHTTDFIYFKDCNSVFTLCSESLLERLTGSREGTLAGKSDFDFFDTECAQRFFEDEQEIMRTGEPIIGKVEMEARNGKNTWVFTSKLPLRNVEGKVIGTFGISRDVTKQKQTELKLQETNEKLVEASRRAGKAEIATNVIHNVGNVLTSVKVALTQSEEICSEFPSSNLDRVADLIERHGKDADFFEPSQRGSHIPEYLRGLSKSFEEEKAKLKKELADSQKHLDHISRIVAQQQRYAAVSKFIEKVDLSELVSDAIQMSSSSLKNHKIEVIQNFNEGLVAYTDKHQVLQIVVNLIRNAKHACLDSTNIPRRITISATNLGESQFAIRVEDNGIGIAEKNFAKLFTYGFTTRQQGKGFGLHSCANAAKELGGSLNVSSDGPGKGATFVLTLPGKLN